MYRSVCITHALEIAKNDRCMGGVVKERTGGMLVLVDAVTVSLFYDVTNKHIQCCVMLT